VLRWEPERAFEQVLPPEHVPAFMSRIDFFEWNRRRDAGMGFELGEQELAEAFPADAAAVRAYRQYFGHTLTGLVEGTGAIIAELQRAGVRLLALTNWSAETFSVAWNRFQILRRFEHILVSGEVGLAKPDPAVFELLCRQHHLTPAECVFVDDSTANVAGAAQAGLLGIHFRDAPTLRGELERLGLVSARQPIGEPIFHLTEREVWQAARLTGTFGWSSRGLPYAEQGYLHCSFRRQLDDVARSLYSDLPPELLAVLELDPDALTPPVVLEDLDGLGTYPHVYGELPAAEVVGVHSWPLQSRE
jgi:2-haloacid dehalogenase